MRKVAIFMSDFHLGQKNRVEEFHTDDEFAELLGRLSQFHAENEVDLVLLGDVLDLWTTVTNPLEERAETLQDIDLYLPIMSAPMLPAALYKEKEKVSAIIAKHPTFFETLGRFLIHEPKKRRVLYVPGNHDHSLVSTDLQQIIVDSILTPPIMELSQRRNPTITKDDLARQIEFPIYYKDDYLAVYAEHGNQLTYGGVFRYDDGQLDSTFNQFGSECPGYVQFKAVSSRVERCAPKLNGLLMGLFNPANWPGLASWLLFRGYFKALIYLQRFRIQFLNSIDPRVNWARQELPPEWKTILYLLKTRFFSVTKDEFGDLLPKLFDQGTDPLTMPLCGYKLDSSTIKTIVLGHSHGAKDIDVPGFDGLKYYNTGSWILRQENNREVVEQTWVTISRELPVIVAQINRAASGTSITVRDKFQQLLLLKLATLDLLHGVEVGDQVLIERDENGAVSSILQDDPLSRKVINRQMNRRRVELMEMAYSPVTTDGRPLNDVLRSMDLRIGDLMLFHWNFGAYLWRIARTQPGGLLRAIPGVVTGAINRLGTSSYWNHIAMVYGSPSERQESDHYNDPLIIESVPGTGVSIHTPHHYLEYPKEWDFAVLRLHNTNTMLDSWEARCLLRRITLGYLGAAYDMETVARGTIAYAALTMDAKGRSAIGGAVYGAILGFIVCTLGILWWASRQLYNGWPDYNWGDHIQLRWQTLETVPGYLVKEFGYWPPDIVVGLLKIGELVLLVIGMAIAGYIAFSLLRLATKTWLVATAAMGSVVGLCIVPVMSDIAEGWTEMPTARRIGFVMIWFSPLLLLLLSSSIVEASAELEWQSLVKIKIILVLSAALITILFAEKINRGAEPFIDLIDSGLALVRRLADRLGATLGWPACQEARCDGSRLEKQFICSGLVQQAFVDTARELQAQNINNVIVNPEWNANQSAADQLCVFRDTMPKHFALANEKFTWTYLYLDRVLTPNPSPGHKAQAYTAPVLAQRATLCQPSVRAIKCGFTGAFLTILASVAGEDLINALPTDLFQFDLSEKGTKTSLLFFAVILGITAIVYAKNAQRDLALQPTQRGRALTIYGFISGAAATAVGLVNLGILSDSIPLVPGIVGYILLFSLGSAAFLLF